MEQEPGEVASSPIVERTREVWTKEDFKKVRRSARSTHRDHDLSTVLMCNLCGKMVEFSNNAITGGAIMECNCKRRETI